MAVSHKGAISFGLVHIPVALYTATQDIDVHFNQLHEEDHARIRYKKTCAHCGKEIKSEDIVKGFEYDKDRYVIITDEDLERIKTDKDRTISILHFADLKSIKPIFYDKTYHAVPEAGGEKAFELLRTAMKQENKVAIAKTVMGNKETLIAIMPAEEGIYLETMFFGEEIKDLPKAYSHPEINEAELTMAKTLIASMVRDFDPALYRDEYQARLRELIEQKIAGKEFAVSEPEESGRIVDLMEALKQSIEQTKAPAKKSGGAKSKAKGVSSGAS